MRKMPPKHLHLPLKLYLSSVAWCCPTTLPGALLTSTLPHFTPQLTTSYARFFYCQAQTYKFPKKVVDSISVKIFVFHRDWLWFKSRTITILGSRDFFRFSCAQSVLSRPPCTQMQFCFFLNFTPATPVSKAKSRRRRRNCEPLTGSCSTGKTGLILQAAMLFLFCISTNQLRSFSMEWTTPQHEVIDLNCEISSYANAEL